MQTIKVLERQAEGNSTGKKKVLGAGTAYEQEHRSINFFNPNTEWILLEVTLPAEKTVYEAMLRNKGTNFCELERIAGVL